jgi:hypothetical protein
VLAEVRIEGGAVHAKRARQHAQRWQFHRREVVDCTLDVVEGQLAHDDASVAVDLGWAMYVCGRRRRGRGRREEDGKGYGAHLPRHNVDWAVTKQNDVVPTNGERAVDACVGHHPCGVRLWWIRRN